MYGKKIGYLRNQKNIDIIQFEIKQFEAKLQLKSSMQVYLEDTYWRNKKDKIIYQSEVLTV